MTNKSIPASPDTQHSNGRSMPATKSRSECNHPLTPLEKAIWDELSPAIEQAEESQDLGSLRNIEADLHRMLTNLVERGLYRVQFSAAHVATELGQPLTYPEAERIENESDILFGRAFDKEHCFDLAEQIWLALLTWIEAHGGSRDFADLIEDYSTMLHAWHVLDDGGILSDYSANQLVEAWRHATLVLHAQKTGR